MIQLEIVIPLWNEARNIPLLINMIESSTLIQSGHAAIILVNNGSSDNSAEILSTLGASRKWLKIITLKENQNYGGGIYHGLKQSTAPYIGFISGDMQIHFDDVQKLWNQVQENFGNNKILYKGYRNTRKDGWQSRIVSRIYTLLTMIILNIRIKDANGLPKIFHRDLLDLLSSEVMKTFVFDAQLTATAYHNQWKILELPVTFYARHEGTSSWSRKKVHTYWTSLLALCRLRLNRLIYPQLGRHEKN